MVRRQFQRWRQRRKLFFPILKLRFISLTRQRVALPCSIIYVLDWQFRQRRLAAGCISSVKLGKLSIENAHRPSVDNDVVHRDQQQVLALIDPHEQRAHQRIIHQIKRTASFVFQQTQRFGFTILLWSFAKID